MFQSDGGKRSIMMLRMASSALDTCVPPVAGERKKVFLVHLLGRVRVADEDDLDPLVLPCQEDIEQHVEALGEVLHVLGHRAGDIHQAEHHRLGHRLRLVLEAAIADVDRDRYRGCAAPAIPVP